MEWNRRQLNSIPISTDTNLRKYVSLSSSGNIALVPYFNTPQGFVKYMTYKYDSDLRPWKRIGNASRPDRVQYSQIYGEIDSNRRNKPFCFGNAVWSGDDMVMVIASTEEIRVYDYYPSDYPSLGFQDVWLPTYNGNSLLEMPAGDSDQIPSVAISGFGNIIAWSRKGQHLIRIARKKINGWETVNTINVGKRNVNFGYSMALNDLGTTLIVASEERDINRITVKGYYKKSGEDKWEYPNVGVSTTPKFDYYCDVRNPDRQLHSVAISDNGDVVLLGCLKYHGPSEIFQAVIYRLTGADSNRSWSLETIDVNTYRGDYTVYLSPNGNLATITSEFSSEGVKDRTIYVYKYHPNSGWQLIPSPIHANSEVMLTNLSASVVRSIGSNLRLTYISNYLNISSVFNVTYTASPYPAAYGYWDKLGSVDGTREHDQLGYAAMMNTTGNTIVAAAVGENNNGEITIYEPSVGVSSNSIINSQDSKLSLRQKGNTIKGSFSKGLLGKTVTVDKSGTMISLGSVNGVSETYQYLTNISRFKPESNYEGAERFLKQVTPRQGASKSIANTNFKIKSTLPFIDIYGQTFYESGVLDFTGEGDIYDDGSNYGFAPDIVYLHSRLIFTGTGTWSSDARPTVSVAGTVEVRGTTRVTRFSVFSNPDRDDLDQSGFYYFDLVPTDINYLRSSGVWRLQNGRVIADYVGSNGFGRKTKNVIMSSDGSSMFVGEPDSSNSLGGQVEIFKRVNDSWKYHSVLLGNNGEAFGYSLAANMNGSLLAVGTVTKNNDDSFRGVVRLFQFIGYYQTVGSITVYVAPTVYTKIGNDIIGETTGDAFGYSLAINDTAGIVAPGEDIYAALDRHSYLVIGAPYYDTIQLNTGRIYRYRIQTDKSQTNFNDRLSWVKDSFVENGTFSYDTFGKCVAMTADGVTIAVGAPSDITGGSASVIDYSIKARLTEDIPSIYNNEALGMEVSIADGAFGKVMMTSSPMYSIKNLAGGQVSMYTLKPFIFATIMNRDPLQYDLNDYFVNRTTGYLFNKINGNWTKTTANVPLSEVYQNVVVSYGKPGRNYTKPQPICFDLRNNVIYRRNGQYGWEIIKKILKYILRGNTPPVSSDGVKDDYYYDVRSGLLYGPRGTGWDDRKPFKLSLSGNEPIFVGNFIPDSNDGVIGDYYVNLVDGIVYGPKIAPSIGSPSGWQVSSQFHKTLIVGTEKYINKNLGTNKDYYLNISSGELTGPKSDLGWNTDPFKISLEDLSSFNTSAVGGNTLYFGFDNNLNNAEGNKGDYYINFNDGIMYGPKPTNISWTNVEKLFVAKPSLKGEQAPLTSDGIIGDYYINIDTLDFYGPKSANGWSSPLSKFPIELSMTDVILVSRKYPKEIEGHEGEYFVNVTDNTLFGPKLSTTDSTHSSLWEFNQSWNKNALILSVDPVSTDGVEGDYCLNTTSLELFVKMRSDIIVAWKSCDVKLIDGISSLSVGVYRDPTSNDGIDGDYHYNRYSNQLFNKNNKHWLESASRFGNQIVRNVTSLPDVDLSGDNVFLTGRTLLNTLTRDIYRFLKNTWEQTCYRLPLSIPTSSTIITGIVDPTTEGIDGDYYYNVVSNEIFGPKGVPTPNSYPSPIPMDLIALVRSANPRSQELSNGDYVYNNTTKELYGPKTQYNWPLAKHKFRLSVLSPVIHIVDFDPTTALGLVNGEYYFYNDILYDHDGIPIVADKIVYSRQYNQMAQLHSNFGDPGDYLMNSDTMTLYSRTTNWTTNSPYKLPNSVKTEGKILVSNEVMNIGTVGDFILNITDMSIHGPKSTSYPLIDMLPRVMFKVASDPMFDSYGKTGDYAYDYENRQIIGPKISDSTWMGAATVKFNNFIEDDSDIIVGTSDTPPIEYGVPGDYYFFNGNVLGRRDKNWIVLPEFNPDKLVTVRYGHNNVSSADYLFDLDNLTMYNSNGDKLIKVQALFNPYSLIYFGTTPERGLYPGYYFFDTDIMAVVEPFTVASSSAVIVSKPVLEQSGIPFVQSANFTEFTFLGEKYRIPRYARVDNSVMISESGPKDGIFGDYMFDLTTRTVYGPKQNDSWEKSRVYWKLVASDSGLPQTIALPETTMYYMNENTGELFKRSSASWVSQNIQFPELTNIIYNDIGGVPSNYIGFVNDYYLDSVTNFVYGPKTTQGWPTELTKVNQIAYITVGGAVNGNVNIGTDISSAIGNYSMRVESVSSTLDNLYLSPPRIFKPNSKVKYVTKEILIPNVPKNTRLLVGHGVPTEYDGIPSDYYFDVDSDNIFGPKSANWTTGTYIGIGVTVLTTGTVIGNNYFPVGTKSINVNPSDLYTVQAPDGYLSVDPPAIKANNVWRSADLKRVHTVTAEPDYGIDGDYYFNTNTLTIYGPRQNNLWPSYGIKYNIKFKPRSFYILQTSSVQGTDTIFDSATIDAIKKLNINDYYFDPILADLVNITVNGPISIPKIALPEPGFIQEVTHGAWYVNSLVKKLFGPYNNDFGAEISIGNINRVLIGYRAPDIADGTINDFYYNAANGDVYSPKSDLGWQRQIALDVKFNFDSVNGEIQLYDRKMSSSVIAKYTSRLLRGLQINKIYVGDNKPTSVKVDNITSVTPNVGSNGAYYLTYYATQLYNKNDTWILTNNPNNVKYYNPDEIDISDLSANIFINNKYNAIVPNNVSDITSLGMFPLDISYHFPSIIPADSSYESLAYVFDAFTNKLKINNEYRQILDTVDGIPLNYNKQAYQVLGNTIYTHDQILPSALIKLNSIDLSPNAVVIICPGIPPTEFGFTGDYYINSITDTVYGPKNGLWNKNPIKTAKWIISTNTGNSSLIDNGDYVFEKSSQTLFMPYNRELSTQTALKTFKSEIVTSNNIYIARTFSDIDTSFEGSYVYAISTDSFHTIVSNTITPAFSADIALVANKVTKNLGNIGDFAFESSTNRLLEKTTDTTWTQRAKVSYKITDNEKIIIGLGVPDFSVGENEDLYYDQMNGKMYGPKDIVLWPESQTIHEIIKINNRDAPLETDGSLDDYILMLQSARVYGPKTAAGWPDSYKTYPEYINTSLRIAVVTDIIANYSDLNNIDVYLLDDRSDSLVPYKLESGKLVRFAEIGTWLPKGNAVAYDTEKYIDFKGGSIPGDSDTIRVFTETFNTNCSVMSGDCKTVAVSSFNNDAGVVRVYEYVNSKWIQKGPAIYGAWHEDFGNSLAISDDGNTVAIGAQNHCEQRKYLVSKIIARTGKLYVYRYDNNKTWTKDYSYLGGREIGRVGYNLSLDSTGNILAFTEPGHLRSTIVGRIRVIRRGTDGQWNPYGMMSNNSDSRKIRDSLIIGAGTGLTIGLFISTIAPFFGPFGPAAMIAVTAGSVIAGAVVGVVSGFISLLAESIAEGPIDKTFLENSGRYHHAGRIDLSGDGTRLMIADFRRNDVIPDQFVERTTGTKILSFIASNLDIVEFLSTKTGLFFASEDTRQLSSPDSFGNVTPVTGLSSSTAIGTQSNPTTSVSLRLSVGGQFSLRTSLPKIKQETENPAVVKLKQYRDTVMKLQNLEKIINMTDRSKEGLAALKWADQSRYIKDTLTGSIYTRPFGLFKSYVHVDTAPSIIERAMTFVKATLIKFVKFLKTVKYVKNVVKGVSGVSKFIGGTARLAKTSGFIKFFKFLGKVSIAFMILTLPADIFTGFSFADSFDKWVSNSGKGVVRVFNLIDSKWSEASRSENVMVSLRKDLPLPTEIAPKAAESSLSLMNTNYEYSSGNHNIIGNENLFASSVSMSKDGTRIAVLGKHSLPGFDNETKEDDISDSQVCIGIYRIGNNNLWFPKGYLIINVSNYEVHQDLFMKLNHNGTKLIVGDPFFSANEGMESCGIVKIFDVTTGDNVIQMRESNCETIIGDYPYAQLGNPFTIDIGNTTNQILAGKNRLLPDIDFDLGSTPIETNKHFNVYVRVE